MKGDGTGRQCVLLKSQTWFMFLIIQSEFLYRGLNVVHPVIYFPREKMSPTYPLLSISSNPPLSLTLLNSSPFWINGYLPYEILDGKSIIPYEYTCRVEFMFINTSKRSSNVPIFVCVCVCKLDTSHCDGYVRNFLMISSRPIPWHSE